MLRLLLGLFLLFLVLVTLVGLPVAYAVWLVKTWRCGRKGLFWSQTGVLAMTVAVLVFLLDATPASHWYWERKRASEWTGFAFSFEKMVYHYATGPSFNGDGYVLTVATLRPEAAGYFHAPPPAFFADFPKEKDPRYTVQRWRPGPVRTEDEFFLKYAFAETPPGKEAARLKEALEAIRRSLGKPTTQYAYSYLMHGDAVGDIVFWLIDPEDRRFYFISNHS